MALFKIEDDKFVEVDQTNFETEGLTERYHIQKLLKNDISIISDDLIVIAEEYSNWEDSRKRIDLLCLNKNGFIVVMELKRTEDGSEMELQALRYAAMVSSMTPSQLIEAHFRYLQKENKLPGDANGIEYAENIIKCFVPDFEDGLKLGKEVKIILVSADFSKELTTSVLWLNGMGLDIKCTKLKPYKLNGCVLVDSQQIIPLPEASEYETKIRDREIEERTESNIRHDARRRFWAQLLQYSKSITDLFSKRSPSTDSWLSTGIGRAGFMLVYFIRQHDAGVECYIDYGQDGSEKNKVAFEYLLSKKEVIEKSFGDSLDWQPLEEKRACRIRKITSTTGWKANEEKWEEIQKTMIEAMIRLDAALKDPIMGFRYK